MKKLTITLLVFLSAALLLTVTCPKADAHKETFKEVANQAVQQELGATSDVATNIIGGLITGRLVDNLVDSRMTVRNYFVCSVGFLSPLDGSEPQLVTVGLLNHVFAPTPEQIREYVDK